MSCVAAVQSGVLRFGFCLLASDLIAWPNARHSALRNLNFELGLCPKVCFLDSLVLDQRPALSLHRNPADFEDISSVADPDVEPALCSLPEANG